MRMLKKKTSGPDLLHNVLTTIAIPWGGSLEVDIVLVHGLKGSAQKSWCKDGKSELFWPQVWLPLDIPHSRISTFSYDANPYSGSDRWSDITGFALTLMEQLEAKEIGKNCPIIFVAHDMGGLIVKTPKMYRRSGDYTRYKYLYTATTAIIFLGTPHRGADYFKKYKRLFSQPKLYIEEQFPGSSRLQWENDFFRHIAPRLKLCSFYESLPAGKVLVPKDTAVLGLKGERNEMFEADHKDMCRFASRDDANYKKLVHVLRLAVAGVDAAEWDPKT